VFYNIRFTSITKEQQDEIRKEIAEKGEAAPWARKLPRIATEAAHMNMPGPILCTVKYGGNSYIMNVRDYTLGGVKLEYLGVERLLIPFGDKIVFELLTSDHETIMLITGEIRHIAEESIATIGTNVLYGVKIISMPSSEEKKYKDMILKYCMQLKDNFSKS
jgi:hypothetical protein